ncbi:MAG: ABC transporter ATP-binding protein [Anaerolineales bacterium]|nr:ABC transporter ATP-binding protein [Anaerolineales bacterium]
MGFFRGLDAEGYDRTYSDRDLAHRMLTYFAPYRGAILTASIAVLLTALIGAVSPILIARSVDLLKLPDSELWMTLITAALFVIGVVDWGANWARRRIITRTVANVMFDLRRDAFAATVDHDLSFHDRFSSGRIVSRVTSDTQDFSEVVVLLTDLLAQVVQTLVLLVVLLQAEATLTLMMLATLPFIFYVAVSFRRLARRVTREGFRAMANVNAAIKEAVTGIAVAKNFRQEEAIYSDFEAVNQTSYQTNVRRGVVLSLVFPTINALSGIGTAILVLFGGRYAAAGIVSIGSWYLFVRSLQYFWSPIINLSSFWTQVQSGLSAAERVFALIDAETVVRQTDPHPVPPLTGAIDFDRISFHYKPEEPILDNFSLRIAAGESLALVGHTGAGKTSIARLIARFYEFQAGRLLLDELDIRSFDLQDYRRQLGIVPQSPFLFKGSVLDNIRYGKPGAGEGEILSLAKQIGGGEWLEALPEGLQTEVGERGSHLSMGQRQLVSLMRVLVQAPAIFILDEATASIDPFTESQIQEALALILQRSTSILIAHRLWTVQAADRILVLDRGEIIEEGDHDALMAQHGHYAELYNTYFRHQSLDYIEHMRRRH